MEINCTKDKLIDGVQSVERIVSTRNTLPIVGNILFEAIKNGIRISANNLEIGLEAVIPAETKEEGALLIPAKTFAGIVAKLPADGIINIKKTEKESIKVSYRKSNFNINGLSHAEFPQIPKIKDAKTISVPPKILLDMIKHTVFSTSTSEDKYVLNGVLIETGKGAKDDASNIRMVATDGFRLARKGDKVDASLENSSVIVPAKALNEISRILQNKEIDNVEISISSEQIAFKYKDGYLVSRLIQGQFPNYKQVMPKNSDVIITVGTKTFLESAERAAVIAAGSSNIVKLSVNDKSLSIAAVTPDVGSVEEIIEIEISGVLQKPIAFNVRLILDVLKVIESDKVSLEFSGPLGPGVIKPLDGSDYIYIIMPIRTTDTAA